MKLLLALFFASAALLHAADPVVSNLSASQRVGTELVDISYDVTADTATVTTSLRISSDGGATFTVPAVTLSGDIGPDVAVGTGKTITWDAGTDWDEQFSETMRFELTADDGRIAGPDGMVPVQGETLTTSNADLNGTDVAAFQIGQHEVTWGEWQTVRSWAASNGYDIGSRGAGCASDHPVYNVNWYDIVKWCNARSEMEGMAPVYATNGSTYRSGEPTHTDISQIPSSYGYRLPSEAEWEFAARGGNQTNDTTYAGSNDLNIVGWYSDNSDGGACSFYGLHSRPVGQKAANELGLYDMSGNVWEWCWDQNGSRRRVRSGSWGNQATNCAVAFRNDSEPGNRYGNYGFRLARNAPAPEGMVTVQGGTLTTSNELDGTEVATFQIGQYEVTWGEWQTVRSWAASNGYDIGNRGEGCADDHPVNSVAWYDVAKWCNAKSEMDGLTPVYTFNGTTYRSGEPWHTDISQNLLARGYRLPQEVEWEFAARGGNQTSGFTYSGSNDKNEVSWNSENSGGAACDLSNGLGTWPIGQKAANELGLYDMSGNVREWCWDDFGQDRRTRGNSYWGSGGGEVASRVAYSRPDDRSTINGFRLARTPSP